MFPATLDISLQLEPEMCLYMLNMKKNWGSEEKHSKNRAVLTLSSIRVEWFYCVNMKSFMPRLEKCFQKNLKSFLDY